MNLQFDNELNKINNLKWLPWIGDNFDKYKFLIVGESHYLSDMPASIESASRVDYTRRNIIEIGINGNSYGTKTYQNLHKCIFGEKRFNTESFWNSVAYHNIIQSPMKTKKVRPSKSDFSIGWSVLLELIELLDVKTCLFVGNTASKYLLNIIINNVNFSLIGEVDYLKKIGNAYAKRAIIKVGDNKQTKLVFIKHTASHFSWKAWNEFLNEELSKEIHLLRQAAISF